LSLCNIYIQSICSEVGYLKTRIFEEKTFITVSSVVIITTHYTAWIESTGRVQMESAIDNVETDRSFRTLCYTADGQHLLAAGHSKNICIYSVEHQILCKKFEITCNLSFDGTLVSINRNWLFEDVSNKNIITFLLLKKIIL